MELPNLNLCYSHLLNIYDFNSDIDIKSANSDAASMGMFPCSLASHCIGPSAAYCLVLPLSPHFSLHLFSVLNRLPGGPLAGLLLEIRCCLHMFSVRSSECQVLLVCETRHILFAHLVMQSLRAGICFTSCGSPFCNKYVLVA